MSQQVLWILKCESLDGDSLQLIIQMATILMVTHDVNAASFCSRILFIRDGVIFHELRKKVPENLKIHSMNVY